MEIEEALAILGLKSDCTLDDARRTYRGPRHAPTSGPGRRHAEKYR